MSVLGRLKNVLAELFSSEEFGTSGRDKGPSTPFSVGEMILDAGAPGPSEQTDRINRRSVHLLSLFFALWA